MTLRPVILAVPDGEILPRNQRMPVQRAAAAEAINASARLCGYEVPPAWPRDDRNIPAPHAGIHWSLTHKPRYVAGVVSDVRVGIDIEPLAPRRDEHLFRRIAMDEEWELLGGRSWAGFFRAWTANEATLKANGFGIARLSSCRIVAVHDESHLTTRFDGREFPIEHFQYDEHLVAVTTAGYPVVWNVP